MRMAAAEPLLAAVKSFGNDKTNRLPEIFSKKLDTF